MLSPNAVTQELTWTTIPVDMVEAVRRSTAKPAPRDAAGFAYFAEGETGAAHDLAHRLLDAGECRRGYDELGAWLAEHEGSGSEWIHLHWHLAVFELGIGLWDDAHDRFRREILPAASTTELALTDAPSMLWRLKLAAPAPVDLPWEPVRATALDALRRPSDAYVALHNLLALAGAGDIDNLDRWLIEKASEEIPRRCRLVVRMGLGLRALAVGDYEHARRVIDSVVDYVSEVGGSHGQNLLFGDIAKTCRALAATLEPPTMERRPGRTRRGTRRPGRTGILRYITGRPAFETV